MDGVRKVVKDMEMALQHLADAIGEIRRTNDQPIAWIGFVPMPSCLIDPFIEAYERCG